MRLNCTQPLQMWRLASLVLLNPEFTITYNNNKMADGAASYLHDRAKHPQGFCVYNCTKTGHTYLSPFFGLFQGKFTENRTKLALISAEQNLTATSLVYHKAIALKPEVGVGDHALNLIGQS